MPLCKNVFIKIDTHFLLNAFFTIAVNFFQAVLVVPKHSKSDIAYLSIIM